MDMYIYIYICVCVCVCMGIIHVKLVEGIGVRGDMSRYGT